MTSLEQDLAPFLDELPSYNGKNFYDLVKKFVGAVESEILEIQRIKNVRILLKITDVFSFFQVNNKDLALLKEQACLIGDNSCYIVRPGIRSNLEEFIEVLKNHYQPTTTSIQGKVSNSCICNIRNYENNDNQSNSFVYAFVNNLIKNLSRSSNNYQFDDLVCKFASVLNILAGHQAYEFVRINLPGSLPSITTLKTYNQHMNLRLNEGEFRFDSLVKYLESIDSSHVFMVCV